MPAYDVAVVGGGPAGLSAAATAGRYGASVVLIDEWSELGGRLLLDRAHRGLRDALVNECRTANVEMRQATSVWGVFPGWQLALNTHQGQSLIQAEVLVLATGSTDRPITFSGATLPGVMTASAVCRLIELYRVIPGQRFVIIGDGPEADLAMRSIEQALGEIVFRVEAKSAPELVAFGEAGVEMIAFRGSTIEADIVVVATGRQPDVQLCTMAEAQLFWRDYAWFPVRNDRFETSQPGLLVAGDMNGPTDVNMAAAEGRFAGVCVAARLGLASDDEIEMARPSRQYPAPLAAASYCQPWRVPFEVSH